MDRTERAVDLYVNSGMKQRYIAGLLGVSSSRVGQLLRSAGVTGRPSGSFYRWPVQDMLRWYQEEKLGCEQIAQRLGFGNSQAVGKVLRKHGCQMRRTGPQLGSRHPDWKGGRRIDKSGYVLIYAPDHPYCGRGNKCVREHRLVMESVLGRYLRPEEVVHHKDGNRQNNSPENLELFESNADHLRETLVGQVPQWTEDGRRRISEGVRQRWQRARNRLKRA